MCLNKPMNKKYPLCFSEHFVGFVSTELRRSTPAEHNGDILCIEVCIFVLYTEVCFMP